MFHKIIGLFTDEGNQSLLLVTRTSESYLRDTLLRLIELAKIEKFEPLLPNESDNRAGNRTGTPVVSPHSVSHHHFHLSHQDKVVVNLPLLAD